MSRKALVARWKKEYEDLTGEKLNPDTRPAEATK